MENPTLEQTPKMLLEFSRRFDEFADFFSNHRLCTREEVEKPIDINEASQFLGRAKDTMYKDVQNNVVPYYKKAGRLYFLKSELLEWIKSGKIKTNSEISDELDNLLSSKK